MNQIQTEKTGRTTNSLAVEFYPSIDDYVHIAERVSASVETPPTIQYSYQIFLFINAIVFPGFLWFNDYYFAGALVLAVNIVALSMLIPWFTRDGYRAYYKQVVGPRENEVARVELNPDGILYTSDDGESFFPWRRITTVEETDQAIYFYFTGNGFAVRKSGFAYRADQDAFLNVARSHLQSADVHQLEQWS